jgi:hypothetical protein
MRTATCTLLALVGLAAGCTDDGDPVAHCNGDGICPTEEARACLARPATIDTGFYGCVLAVNDVGEAWSQPLASIRVHLFAAGDHAAPVVVGVSDDRGFYQLAPPPGAYEFCPADGGLCSATFTIADGTAMPVDVMVSALVLWQPR